MAAFVWLKALVLWLAILALAILNGALRERLVIPLVGQFGGLIASGVILSCCVFAIALLASPWYGALASSQWWLIGLLWLLLTLLFELGFGRLVQGRQWTELAQAYTFAGGNIWPVVLVVTFTSPWLAAKLRGLAL